MCENSCCSSILQPISSPIQKSGGGGAYAVPVAPLWHPDWVKVYEAGPLSKLLLSSLNFMDGASGPN